MPAACSFHGQGIWGTYSNAVLPGLNIVEGGQTSTGSVVAWYRRVLGLGGYAELNEEAGAVPPGCEGVVCLDHFQVLGEGVFPGLGGHPCMDGEVFIWC